MNWSRQKVPISKPLGDYSIPSEALITNRVMTTTKRRKTTAYRYGIIRGKSSMSINHAEQKTTRRPP